MVLPPEEFAKHRASFGDIVHIKSNGRDGARFPAYKRAVIFGSGTCCDIRIFAINAREQHASLMFDSKGFALIMNLDQQANTILNGVEISKPTLVGHMNVFVVGDRFFRLEYAPHVSCLFDPNKRLDNTPLSVVQSALPVDTVAVPSQTEAIGHDIVDSNVSLKLTTNSLNLTKRENLPPATLEGESCSNNAEFLSPTRTKRTKRIATPKAFPTPVKKSLRSICMKPIHRGPSNQPVDFSVEQDVEPVVDSVLPSVEPIDSLSKVREDTEKGSSDNVSRTSLLRVARKHAMTPKPFPQSVRQSLRVRRASCASSLLSGHNESVFPSSRKNCLSELSSSSIACRPGYDKSEIERLADDGVNSLHLSKSKADFVAQANAVHEKSHVAPEQEPVSRDASPPHFSSIDALASASVHKGDIFSSLPASPVVCASSASVITVDFSAIGTDAELQGSGNCADEQDDSPPEETIEATGPGTLEHPPVQNDGKHPIFITCSSESSVNCSDVVLQDAMVCEEDMQPCLIEECEKVNRTVTAQQKLSESVSPLLSPNLPTQCCSSSSSPRCTPNILENVSMSLVPTNKGYPDGAGSHDVAIAVVIDIAREDIENISSQLSPNSSPDFDANPISSPPVAPQLCHESSTSSAFINRPETSQANTPVLKDPLQDFGERAMQLPPVTPQKLVEATGPLSSYDQVDLKNDVATPESVYATNVITVDIQDVSVFDYKTGGIPDEVTAICSLTHAKDVVTDDEPSSLTVYPTTQSTCRVGSTCASFVPESCDGTIPEAQLSPGSVEYPAISPPHSCHKVPDVIDSNLEVYSLTGNGPVAAQGCEGDDVLEDGVVVAVESDAGTRGAQSSSTRNLSLTGSSVITYDSQLANDNLDPIILPGNDAIAKANTRMDSFRERPTLCLNDTVELVDSIVVTNASHVDGMQEVMMSSYPPGVLVPIQLQNCPQSHVLSDVKKSENTSSQDHNGADSAIIEGPICSLSDVSAIASNEVSSKIQKTTFADVELVDCIVVTNASHVDDMQEVMMSSYSPGVLVPIQSQDHVLSEVKKSENTSSSQDHNVADCAIIEGPICSLSDVSAIANNEVSSTIQTTTFADSVSPFKRLPDDGLTSVEAESSISSQQFYNPYSSSLVQDESVFPVCFAEECPNSAVQDGQDSIAMQFRKRKLPHAPTSSLRVELNHDPLQGNLVPVAELVDHNSLPTANKRSRTHQVLANSPIQSPQNQGNLPAHSDRVQVSDTNSDHDDDHADRIQVAVTEPDQVDVQDLLSQGKRDASTPQAVVTSPLHPNEVQTLCTQNQGDFNDHADRIHGAVADNKSFSLVKCGASNRQARSPTVFSNSPRQSKEAELSNESVSGEQASSRSMRKSKNLRKQSQRVADVSTACIKPEKTTRRKLEVDCLSSDNAPELDDRRQTRNLRNRSTAVASKPGNGRVIKQNEPKNIVEEILGDFAAPNKRGKANTVEVDGPEANTHGDIGKPPKTRPLRASLAVDAHVGENFQQKDVQTRVGVATRRSSRIVEKSVVQAPEEVNTEAAQSKKETEVVSRRIKKNKENFTPNKLSPKRPVRSVATTRSLRSHS